jgi:hypothetical protein
MGVQITLTDRQLPVSPVFVDFLDHIVEERPFEPARWGDQLSEDLSGEQQEVVRRAAESAQRIIQTELGQKHVGRAYQFLVALMTGDLEPIKDLQLNFHFINVIGVPRNGGSYLTKELYRALGFDPETVPNVIAHDGFPEAGPFRFDKGLNSWVNSLQTMAEYLTMVEIYFKGRKPHSGKIVVPKKLTKGSYAGGFFHRVLGHAVENILTVRHPVASCISTYEKSGGLPADGRFKVRSTIEEWVRRDLIYTGCEPEEIESFGYFDAYLRYWEQYHYYVATTGLSANRDITILAYGRERMMEQARSFFYRFQHPQPQPEEFKVFDYAERHRDWMERADPALERVAAVWARVGLELPVEQLREAC